MGIFSKIRDTRVNLEAGKEPVAWIALERKFTIHHARGAAQGVLTAHGPEKDMDDGYGCCQRSVHALIREQIYGLKGEVMRDGYYNGPEWISPYSVQSIVFAEENEEVAPEEPWVRVY